MFSAKHYTLVKASKQFIKSLVSTQNEINLRFCLLLQSFKIKPSNYVNTCDQTNQIVQLNVG